MDDKQFIEEFTAAKMAQNFRLYYNKEIHPVLLRLEIQRKRLILQFFIALIIFIALGVLTFMAHIPALSLFLWLPLILFGSLIGYKIQQFKANFKPRVVNLILDFIGPGMRYDYKATISQEYFTGSQIFAKVPAYYKGEDYIEGKIGEVDFEMAELDTREFSPISNRLETIFRGIFFHANFNHKFNGSIVILPKEDNQFLISTIKEINRQGGRKIRPPHKEFNKVFIAYADRQVTDTRRLLSKEMLDSIVDYSQKAKKKIYVSLVYGHIYIAVSEPKDILEPNILTSNVSFKLVKDFFEDLTLITGIVKDFDLKH